MVKNFIKFTWIIIVSLLLWPVILIATLISEIVKFAKEAGK